MQLFVFKKQNTGLSNLEVFVDRCNEQNLFFVCDARSKDIDSWVSAGFNVGVQMRTLNQFIQLADDMNADLLIYDNGVLKHEYTYGSAVMVSGVAKYNDADPNESPDSFTEGDVGGTVSGSGKYYPGTQAQLQAIVNEGYTFMGWFDGSDKELSSETIYTIDVEDAVTVYAKFQKQWFDVSFTKNEYIKTVTPESTRVAYGTTANCTAALLDNTGEYEYTFTGWFDGDSNVGSDLTLTTPEIKSAKTFEARGSQSTIEKITVTYTKNEYIQSVTLESEQVNPNSQATGSTAVLLPDDNQYSYSFDGWYVGEEKKGSSLTLTPEELGAITQAITVTAKGIRTTKQYTFTFNENGGQTPSQATITKDYGSTVGELPTCTKESTAEFNYTFAGWFDTQETTGGTQLTTETTITENKTWYARWTEAKRSYTVTFDKNGADGEPVPPTITKEYGAQIGELPTCTFTGNTLTGWFTEATGGTKIETTTTVTADVTYYAQWGATQP